MGIVYRIIEEALSKAEHQGNPMLERLTIGLYFTLAEFSNGAAGIAYTNPEGGGFEKVEEALGKPASDVLGLLSSDQGLAISSGLAAVNALLNQGDGEGEGDPVAILVKSLPAGKAVLVGYFRLYVNLLLELGWEVTVLELKPIDAPREVRVRPWWSFYAHLPNADLVIVTGSTIANHTLGMLEPRLRDSPATKVVVGPSTPYSKSLLDFFDALGFATVTNAGACRRLVSLGASAPQLFKKGCLRKGSAGVSRLLRKS